MRWGFNEMQYLDFRFWNLTGFNQQEKNQHKDAVYIALNNAKILKLLVGTAPQEKHPEK